MRIHDIFFWASVFFLAGVLIASATGNILTAAILILLTLATLPFLSLKFLPLPRGVVALGLVMFLGASYYFAYDYYTQDRQIIFDKKVEFTGIVSATENGIRGQKVVVDDIQLSVPQYPVYEYGDRVKITGKIQHVPDQLKNYFTKEGIFGLMLRPEVAVLTKNQGYLIKARLLKIKDFFEATFQKVLPFNQATFMSGLILGDTSMFTDDFKEAMRLSGTSHLVALSGFNISIIVKTILGILGTWWVTKRFRFPIAVLFIVSFVIMTGAQASVVRAAIMAGLVLLADKTGRVFYFRNAVAAAALVMVLINPLILVFDVGFQLSFAALLGIVYLRPFIQKWLNLKDEPGIFQWREHFLNTSSAQLAVLPLLLYQFGYFSPIGIISNILILEFIPLTMALGFFIGFAAIFSMTLTWIISWPTSVFLGYELGVIHWCSRIINYIL